MSIPADLYALPTMAAVMEARGETPLPLYRCPACTRVLAADAIACTDALPGVGRRFVCFTCASAAFRDAAAAAHHLALAALAPWDGEAGTACRIERDRRVNAALWAVLPGSPLSVDCREAFAGYLARLHRITVDFPSPDSVSWPDCPTLDFAANQV